MVLLMNHDLNVLRTVFRAIRGSESACCCGPDSRSASNLSAECLFSLHPIRTVDRESSSKLIRATPLSSPHGSVVRAVLDSGARRLGFLPADPPTRLVRLGWVIEQPFRTCSL